MYIWVRQLTVGQIQPVSCRQGLPSRLFSLGQRDYLACSCFIHGWQFHFEMGGCRLIGAGTTTEGSRLPTADLVTHIH